MSNVIRLFGRKKIEGPSDPDAIITFAVTDILASRAELARTIKALSEHLDTLDHITDALSDSDTRACFKQAAKRSRESLANAMLDLPIGETCRSTTKYLARERLWRGQVTLSGIAEQECSAR